MCVLAWCGVWLPFIAKPTPTFTLCAPVGVPKAACAEIWVPGSHSPRGSRSAVGWKACGAVYLWSVVPAHGIILIPCSNVHYKVVDALTTRGTCEASMLKQNQHRCGSLFKGPLFTSYPLYSDPFSKRCLINATFSACGDPYTHAQCGICSNPYHHSCSHEDAMVRALLVVHMSHM